MYWRRAGRFVRGEVWGVCLLDLGVMRGAGVIERHCIQRVISTPREGVRCGVSEEGVCAVTWCACWGVVLSHVCDREVVTHVWGM